MGWARVAFVIASQAARKGGTFPSSRDRREDRTGPFVEKYYRGTRGVTAEKRLRIARLLESMVFGPGKLSTLCLHGGGSPAAAMMGIRQLADLEDKRDLARRLSGIEA